MVLEERYWYPDDGGIVWVAGYQLVDADGRFVGRDAPEVAGRGLYVSGVAGAARHHAEALASEHLAPGAGLLLRRDAGNPHDEHAVAVDVPGGSQLGWVPRELAAEIAPSLDSGVSWSCVMLREQRRSPRDPRTGVTMLLAPGAIELRVRGS